jgi:ubiquinone/menaquinone biosynthesis C-methylase UbiE
MTNMNKAKRTIEVACGPGGHSMILADTFLNPNQGVLVSCDISGKMIVKVKETFEQPGWSQVQGNKVIVDLETDYSELKEDSNSELKNICNLTELIANQGDFNKFIFGCRANNEILPFEADFFNSYIANLSLIQVSNRKNMIFEAYRVLAAGGTACFTVWGAWDNCLYMSIPIDVLRNHFSEEVIQEHYAEYFRHFNCYGPDKGDSMRKYLVEAGF